MAEFIYNIYHFLENLTHMQSLFYLGKTGACRLFIKGLFGTDFNIKSYADSVEDFVCSSFEPRREKTGLRGFRPGPTQTGLYKLRKELEA